MKQHLQKVVRVKGFGMLILLAGLIRVAQAAPASSVDPECANLFQYINVINDSTQTVTAQLDNYVNGQHAGGEEFSFVSAHQSSEFNIVYNDTSTVVQLAGQVYPTWPPSGNPVAQCQTTVYMRSNCPPTYPIADMSIVHRKLADGKDAWACRIRQIAN